MPQDDLERLMSHAAAGAELASRVQVSGDEDLRARVAAYRRAAEALSGATDRRTGPDGDADATTDPQAVALAARLAEETGTEMTSELVLLAREEIDALDGDLEGAYRRLHERS